MASTFSVFGNEACMKTVWISLPSTVESDVLIIRTCSVCCGVTGCASIAAARVGEMTRRRCSAHVRSRMMATPAIEQTSSGHMAIPPRKNHSGMRKSSLSIVEGEIYLARFLPNQRAQFIGQRIERSGFYDGFLAKQRHNATLQAVGAVHVPHLSVVEQCELHGHYVGAFVNPVAVDQRVPVTLHGFNELLVVRAERTFLHAERGHAGARDARNRQVGFPRHNFTARHAGLGEDGR